jgi:ATP-binding cassette subfamily C protein LapB
MDVQNERDVIARLKEAAQDRTMIVVTHRTSLLDLVDRVIVIENGRVGADGDKSILARSARQAAGDRDGA